MSAWFSDLPGDEDFMPLRRQARRLRVEEQSFSFHEERRRPGALSGDTSLHATSRLVSARTLDWGAHSAAFDREFASPLFRRGWRLNSDEPTVGTTDDSVKHADLVDIKRSVRELREENQKLQAIVTDVMEVNRRWQRHHSDRELHVQKLLNTIEQLRNVEQPAIKDTSARAPITAVARTAGGSERLAQLEAENARLRLDLEAARRRQQAAEKQHQEHADLLQIQVRSYKDDWEAERREKHAAEERCRELQRQLENIHECGPHLRLCESSSEPAVATHRSPPPPSATFRSSLHLPSLSQARSSKEMKIPHHNNIAIESTDKSAEATPITIGFEDGLALVQSFSVTSPDSVGKKMSVLQIAAPPMNSDNEKVEDQGILTQTNESIACPRCGKIFAPDKHLQFLDHFDECQETLSCDISLSH